jgi:hypothetical protein
MPVQSNLLANNSQKLLSETRKGWISGRLNLLTSLWHQGRSSSLIASLRLKVTGQLEWQVLRMSAHGIEEKASEDASRQQATVAFCMVVSKFKGYVSRLGRSYLALASQKTIVLNADRTARSSFTMPVQGNVRKIK